MEMELCSPSAKLQESPLFIAATKAMNMGLELRSLSKSPSAELQEKPLFIASSGGQGHIAAIMALIECSNLLAEKLPIYEPKIFESKEISLTGGLIYTAAFFGQNRWFQSFANFYELPLIPQEILLQAIENLKNTQPRPYIDMLLDVYKAGFESAAIWNSLQREGKTSELRKLIKWQPQSDSSNYSDVFNYYKALFIKAYQSNAPYTRVISTQPMGLSALSDAVDYYNRHVPLFDDSPKPPLVIHQYLTDLPTEGARHFFNALAILTPHQQQQIKLYGVDITDEIMSYFFKNGYFFQDICSIEKKNNPMIRRGFKDAQYDNSNKFDETLTLKFKTTKTDSVPDMLVKPNEKIASIMLGSQACIELFTYLDCLIDHGVDKILVFGGLNPQISEIFNSKAASKRQYLSQVVLLENQDSQHIAAIMTRSNIVIIRAGGLSVMEQMAMNHHPDQIILIHNADPQG